MHCCIRLALALLLYLIPTLSSATALTYKVEDLDKALEKNVELYLDTLPAIESHQFPQFRLKIIETTQKALQALGYYDPKIELHLDSSELIIQVEAGSPVKLRKVDIQLLGDASKDKAFKRLLKQEAPRPGEILNQGHYEDFKRALDTQAQARGYFDAKMEVSRVLVYPDRLIADVEIRFKSGVRYRFGKVEYGEMTPNTQKLISQMITFKPGKPYRSIKLSNLNKDLSSTGYFQQIDIHPMRAQTKDYHVPIFVGVTPNTQHQLETGIGFSTDEGPRVSLSWDKPWVNDLGHSLSNEATLSTKRAEVTSSYKVPDGNPLLRFYDLQLGYQYKNQEDTTSNLLSTAIHHWDKQPTGWDRDLFFRIQYEDYTQGVQVGKSFLTIPGIAFNRRKANGKLDPDRGNLEMVKLELSSRTWGSDRDFLKLWGRTKWLTTVEKKHRFIARAEQGVIWINDIYTVPPSIRFFTGGDQTVRGYDYESIAPKDRKGKLIGARYMTALGTEYNYQFAEQWRAALFVDTGTATNNYKEPWKVGTGFGVRWITPLGPLKLDFAWGVSEPNPPFRIHFTMGPEL